MILRNIRIEVISKFPLIPAKAGIQIHPQTSEGFTWIPAFAGMSGVRMVFSGIIFSETSAYILKLKKAAHPQRNGRPCFSSAKGAGYSAAASDRRAVRSRTSGIRSRP